MIRNWFTGSSAQPPAGDTRAPSTDMDSFSSVRMRQSGSARANELRQLRHHSYEKYHATKYRRRVPSDDSDTGTGGPNSPEVQAHVGTKTRRQLAMELEAAKKVKRELESRVQRLSEQLEDVFEEKQQLGAMHKNLKERHEALRSSYKSLEQIRTELDIDHGTLKNEFNHLKSEAENTTENKIDSSRYRHIKRHCFDVYASKKGLVYDDTNIATIKKFVEPLIHDALDAPSLRVHVQQIQEQLKSLQEQMLSSVEKFQAVTDEQFAQEFRGLTALVKALSRSIKFTDYNNPVEVDGIRNCRLAKNVEDREWTTRARQKALVEVFVWSQLIDYVFTGAFSILGGDLEILDRFFNEAFGFDTDDTWPVPSELAERWRRTTFEQIVQQTGVDIFEQGVTRHINDTISSLNQNIHNKRMELANAIAEPLFEHSRHVDLGRVEPIVNKAFGLALQMSLQRSRVRVVCPKVGDRFSSSCSDLTSLPESEEVGEGRIALVVNPGLAKWGDAHGRYLDQRLDLVPALVLVEPNISEAHPAELGGPFDGHQLSPPDFQYEQAIQMELECELNEL